MANPRRRSRMANRRPRRTNTRTATPRRLRPIDDEIERVSFEDDESSSSSSIEEDNEIEENTSSSCSTEDPPSTRPLSEDFSEAVMNDNFSATASRGRKTPKAKTPDYIVVKGWRRILNEREDKYVRSIAECVIHFRDIELSKLEEIKDVDEIDSVEKRYFISTKNYDIYVDENEYNRIRAMILPNEQRPEPTTHRPQNALYGMEIT